jgi:hypothetical protein
MREFRQNSRLSIYACFYFTLSVAELVVIAHLLWLANCHIDDLISCSLEVATVVRVVLMVIVCLKAKSKLAM